LADFHGSRQFGWRNMLAFAVICLVVSNIFENLSILTGFPFGHYHYSDNLGPKLLLVPLLIGPAYLGVGYLSWTVARLILGGVRPAADRVFALPVLAALKCRELGDAGCFQRCARRTTRTFVRLRRGWCSPFGARTYSFRHAERSRSLLFKQPESFDHTIQGI
jgi:hypothetical protein